MNILSTAPFRKLPIGIQSFLSLIWQTVVSLLKYASLSITKSGIWVNGSLTERKLTNVSN